MRVSQAFIECCEIGRRFRCSVKSLLRHSILNVDATAHSTSITRRQEYSRRLFEQLPDEEKKYWHSHIYEVKSGQDTSPNIPAAAEKADMGKLINTYGKVGVYQCNCVSRQCKIEPPRLG